MASDDQRLIDVKLDERTVVRRNADVEHERAVAIYDLLDENSFEPVNPMPGPFILHLSVEGDRLALDIHGGNDEPLDRVLMSLNPFRRLIKDYFTVCESYFEAIKTATPSQIEAIDMGRRGLHNDGSELLRERLVDKVEMDFNTARRLFTLICVLHIKG